ncbi:unnamed protein product [Blepharisma stoltei]|uniref:USP domain-containing protein n=1 Tax=Blepharisma stoltei TaxID=1481888 RepID=A0AAU9I8U5_9CILI|nr:unnamed protein product [Blepharisma stoltei]
MGSLCCGPNAVEPVGRSISSSRTKESQKSPSLPQESPKKWWNKEKRPKYGKTANNPVGPPGLQNLGNTCFINAVLQCIFNTQPLQEYFLGGIYQNDISQNASNQGEYARALATLLTEHWLRANKYIRPQEFVNLVWQSSILFRKGLPQDAHEFLSFFLDKLHEDLNRAPKTSKKLATIKGKRSERYAAKSWRSYLETNCSIIIDLFQGQLRSTLKCLNCKGAKVKFENFLHLSLPIPSNIQNPCLDDCMREFTKAEFLVDKWFCPKCQTPVSAAKKYDIWKAPPILIIHLKRFIFNRDKRGKVEGLVNYPLEGFDLTKYTASTQREVPLYEAFARIDHSGSLENGHYSAAVKNKSAQEWYSYDDSLVDKLDETDLVSPEAYVLFYQKTSIREFKRQQFDLPELWPHIVKATLARRPSEVSDQDVSFMSNDSHMSNESYQNHFSDLSVKDSY